LKTTYLRKQKLNKESFGSHGKMLSETFKLFIWIGIQISTHTK